MAGFSQTVARAWSEERLLTVLFELTYNCNLDCFFCYNDTSLKGKELDFSDYKRILIGLKQLNCFTLILSGGEPLSSKHFWKVGKLANEMNFSVRIKSNGHSLNEKVALRIKEEINPYIVEVSLHGGTPSTHDKQTRLNGSFNRLIANLASMKKAGLRIKINSTLTRYNEDEIDLMYGLADSLGIPMRFDPEVTAKDDGDQTPLSIAPSAEGLANLLRVEQSRVPQNDKNKPTKPLKFPKTDRHCGAGSSTMIVDPFGNVYPCVQWRETIGNLHASSVNEIWTSNAVQSIRDENKKVKQWIDNLEESKRPINFCPGVAKEKTGFSTKVSSSQKNRDDVFRLKKLKTLNVIR